MITPTAEYRRSLAHTHPVHAGPDAYERIGFLRANGIGDFVFSLPALAGLHASFPDAEIVYLGSRPHVELLEGRGLVERAYTIPPFPGVTADADAPFDQATIGPFLRTVMEERFDAVVQAHGGGRYSNPLANSLGAPLVVGMRAKDAPTLDREIPYRVYHHEYDRYLELVGLLGAKPDPQIGREPVLPLIAEDFTESERVIPPTAEPFVVVNTGATDGRRRWSEDGFVEVARRVLEAGYSVVLTGDESDRVRTRRVATALEGTVSAARTDSAHATTALSSRPAPQVIDVAGRTSLRGLVGTLARAVAVVSNDTGALHLARALGTPSVGMYWCGNLINAGPSRRTDHRALISWRTYCSECGISCIEGVCGHDASFVTDIPTEHVVLETLDLLETVQPIQQEMVVT